MRVSVIIPTYNRARLLEGTIRSFAAQDFPPGDFEIIVADNNSSDDTRELVEKWRKDCRVRLRYLFEGRQGVHYARNKAAGQALGEILYFTDDDMVADPGLLSALVEVFDMGFDVACATGKVLPRWEQDPPLWILRNFCDWSLSINNRGEDLIIAPSSTWTFSCHQAVLREAFFRSGGFRPENTAGEWVGNGETGLNLKIEELGYKFAYVGRSVIHHVIPGERLTQRYINLRYANQGSCESYTDYQDRKTSPPGLLKNMVLYLLRMVRHGARMLVDALRGRDRWRVHRAYLSLYASRIRYDTRLMRDPRWREFVLREDWLEELPAQSAERAAEGEGKG